MIGSSLLDMLDPSRHVHPGIPYDFYSGYIVVSAERMTGLNRYSSRYAYATVVRGQLPQRVASALSQEHRGRYEETEEEHTIRIKLPPVDVLNILGNLGYRVIGTTSPEKGHMLWTLELKDFEKFASHGNDI